MSNEINFEIFKKFGPTVLKVQIPQNIINNLNNYVDQAILDDKKIQKQNLGEGLVGDVVGFGFEGFFGVEVDGFEGF